MVLDKSDDRGDEVMSPGWDEDTDFAQDTSGGIDACGSLGDVGGSEAVEGGEGVLI